MFDLTDSDTLERVRAWVTELQTLVGPDIVLTVVANKADLAAARAVPAAESRVAAAAVGASYFEVSALSGGARMRVTGAFTVFRADSSGVGVRELQSLHFGDSMVLQGASVRYLRGSMLHCALFEDVCCMVLQALKSWICLFFDAMCMRQLANWTWLATMGPDDAMYSHKSA